MDAESQLLADKDAEVQRLKAEHLKLDEKLEQALRKNENQATLIAKLCAALEEDEDIIKEWVPFSKENIKNKFDDLIQQGREATRGT